MGDRTQRNRKFNRQWLRRILALLLGLILFCDAGVLRAQDNRSMGNGAVEAQRDVIAEGDRLLQDGLQLYNEGSEASLHEAIRIWKQALRWFRRSDLQEKEALALHNIGGAYQKLFQLNQNHRDLEQALVYANRALPLWAENDWFHQANTLHAIGAIYDDLDDLEQAVNHYERALPLWQKSELPINEANTTYWIGYIHARLADWLQAVSYYSRALELWQGESTQLWHSETIRLWRAKTAYGLGQAYKNLGRTSEAIDALDQAARLHQEEGNSSSAAYTLIEIGNLLSAQKEWLKALEYFNQALPLWQANEQSAKADNYNELGKIYLEIFDYNAALEAFSHAFSLYRTIGHQNPMAAMLNNIGQVYSEQGGKEVAQTFFEQALRLYEGAEYKAEKVTTLNNLGLVYEESGEKEKAIEVYQQVLSIQEDLEDTAGRAECLISIARIYYDVGESTLSEYYRRQAESLLSQLDNQGVKASILSNLGYLLHEADPSRALNYLNRALTVQTNLQDWRYAGSTLNSIIMINYDLGETVNAQQAVNVFLAEALPLMEKSGDRRNIAVIYQNIGSISLNTDLKQALDFLIKARDIWKETDTLDKLAETHFLIGAIYSRQHELNKALGEINTAISIVENLRIKSGSDTTRISYFSTVQAYYDAKIDLLMQLSRQDLASLVNYGGEAINTIELTRARSLADLLANSNTDLRPEEVDPELRAEDEQLRQQLGQVEAQLSLEALSDSENQRRLEQQYRDLSERLNRLADEVRATNPAYAKSVKYAVPWRFYSENRINFPAYDNSIFLQYHLGEKQSYLWKLSGDTFEHDGGTGYVGGIGAYSLPDRAEIEAAAQEFLSGVKLGWRESEILQAGACLRQKILPKRVLEMAAGRRLVIAADGILQTVPFAALPLPDPETPETDACVAETFNLDQSQTYQPLIDKYEIVNIPSITSVQILRAQQQASAPKTLAILADPILTTDPRYTNQGNRLTCDNAPRGEADAVPPETLPIELQAALQSTRGTLAPLPCTRSEADAILEKITDQAQKLWAFDYDATQNWVTESPLSEYQIVHFATHGEISDHNPELSGLVFSQSRNDE